MHGECSERSRLNHSSCQSPQDKDASNQMNFPSTAGITTDEGEFNIFYYTINVQSLE
jgi:hypothetical protein